MPLGIRTPLGLSNTLFGTPMFYGLFTVVWCQPSLTPSWLPYTPCCPVHTQICVMMSLFHSMVSETILLSLIVLNSNHLQMHLSRLCHIQFTKSSKMMAHLAIQVNIVATELMMAELASTIIVGKLL